MEVHPIKLFVLPSFAREVIIRNMGFMELFDLSLCSGRCRRVIKNLIKPIGYHLNINIEEFMTSFLIRSNASSNILLQIKCIPISVHLPTENDETHGIGNFPNVISCFGYRHSDNTISLKTYWDNVFVGCQEILKSLSDLFGIPVKLIQVDLYRNKEANLMEWMNNVKPGIMRFGGGAVSSSQYVEVMEKAQPSKALWMGVQPNDIKGIDTIKVSLKQIIIEHAEWVKLYHLLSMECELITIRKSILTNGDFNRFLHYLRDGRGFFKTLSAEVDQQITLGIFRNLNVTWRNGVYELILNGGVCFIQFLNAPAFGRLVITIQRIPMMTEIQVEN